MAKQPPEAKPAPKPEWPECHEKRVLRVDLKPSDIQQLARDSARLGEEIESLEDRKKASASAYKAEIEAKQSARKSNDTSVRNGWVEKEVPCEWFFECSGIDGATGERILHPDKKALIRLDTNEVVDVRDITDSDREQQLPLDQDDEEESE